MTGFVKSTLSRGLSMFKSIFRSPLKVEEEEIRSNIDYIRNEEIRSETITFYSNIMARPAYSNEVHYHLNDVGDLSRVNADLQRYSAIGFLTRKLNAKIILTDVIPTVGQDCSICCDELIKPVCLACTHIFCKKCINKWINTHKTCPLCRISLV